jgi:peptidyl-dipeptidase Dcp
MNKAFNGAASPLINPPELAHGTPAFKSIKIEHIEPAMDWAFNEARKRISAIKSNANEASFENTIEALEFSEEELGRVLRVFSTLSNSKSSDEMRDLEEKIWPKVTEFGNEVLLDDKLFERVKSVYDNKDKLSLSQEQETLLKNTYRAFEKNGALLSQADKIRLKDISSRLSSQTTLFSKNTVKFAEAFKKIITSESDLEGLPERTKAQYAHAADEEGLTGK